jgi:hypothetical protein
MISGVIPALRSWEMWSSTKPRRTATSSTCMLVVFSSACSGRGWQSMMTSSLPKGMYLSAS